MKSNVSLFSRAERHTRAGASGASWEGSADCWDSLRLLALCGNMHASMQGSCGDRAIDAGVDWIIVGGGSWKVDWRGAGVMVAGGTWGIW